MQIILILFAILWDFENLAGRGIEGNVKSFVKKKNGKVVCEVLYELSSKLNENEVRDVKKIFCDICRCVRYPTNTPTNF